MRMSAFLTLAALCTAAVMLVSTPTAAQDATWLDGDLDSWNSPAMAIPTAPAIEGNSSPRCAAMERPAETTEDDALMAAGWRLFLPYQRGWDVMVIPGLAAYDSMCRPLGYQWFVFVDGAFAGTVAPEPMDSRTDGAADNVTLWFKDQLSAEFERYTANDPLCCPSGNTEVSYAIEETEEGPVINPVKPE